MTFSNAFCASPGFPVEGDDDEEDYPTYLEGNPTFKERLQAVHEFNNECMLAVPGDEIPIPYSSEIHIVRSQEEIMHEMLDHPKHCLDTILGTIIQKQIFGEEEIPEESRDPSVLDSSGVSGGIKNLSEKLLHKMYFSQLSKDYSKLTLEDLAGAQTRAYEQMFDFLRKAEESAKRTYEFKLRNGILVAIGDGISDLLTKPCPKFQLMKNISLGIIFIAQQSYTDLSDMYDYLESAIEWAKIADNYGTEAAKRMGRK